MANFNNDVGLNPSYPMNIKRDPKVNTLRFGDGFEQRLTEGLNQNPRIINLIFKYITESQSNTLINFLNTRVNNAESFDYTPPNETIGKFVVDSSYNKKLIIGNFFTVSVTFREVFES